MHINKSRLIIVLAIVLCILGALFIVKFAYTECRITDLTIDPANTAVQGTQVTISAAGFCGSKVQKIEVFVNNRLLGRAYSDSIAVTWDTGDPILASAVTNYVSAYVYSADSESNWATKRVPYPVSEGIVRDPLALLVPPLVDHTCSLTTFNTSPPNQAIRGTAMFIRAKVTCLSEVTKMQVLVGTTKLLVGASNDEFLSTITDTNEWVSNGGQDTIYLTVLEENGGFHEWKFPYSLLGKP